MGKRRLRGFARRMAGNAAFAGATRCALRRFYAGSSQIPAVFLCARIECAKLSRRYFPRGASRLLIARKRRSCQVTLSGQPRSTAKLPRTPSVRPCSASFPVTLPWRRKRVATPTPTTTPLWRLLLKRPRATRCLRTKSRRLSTRRSAPAKMPPTMKRSPMKATARLASLFTAKP